MLIYYVLYCIKIIYKDKKGLVTRMYISLYNMIHRVLYFNLHIYIKSITYVYYIIKHID